MVTTIFHGPGIWVGSPGKHTWWFHHVSWKPGNWLRASLIGRHSPSFEGCHIFRGNVEILKQWTETKTTEDCGTVRRESVAVVHWVTFSVTGESGAAFEPMIILPRFVVHS